MIKMWLNLSLIFFDIEVTCLITITEKIKFKIELIIKNILIIIKI
jgi:hypothetical protein